MDFHYPFFEYEHQHFLATRKASARFLRPGRESRTLRWVGALAHGIGQAMAAVEGWANGGQPAAEGPRTLAVR